MGGASTQPERFRKTRASSTTPGEKISNQESLKRERRYIRNGHIWCFKLTNRTVIDAGVGGNIARFINHSCQPELLHRHQERRHLDPRVADDPAGRGADLPLQHRRRRADQVPVPPGCQTLL